MKSFHYVINKKQKIKDLFRTQFDENNGYVTEKSE